MTHQPTVFLIDDDASIRDALVWLLESVDLAVETFASAAEYLESFDPSRPGCLVLDVRMPGMSGLELQRQLRSEDVDIPVIMVTGHGDVPVCVQAFRAGAFAFMEKPVNHQEFLDEIHRALKHDIAAKQARSSDLPTHVEALSPREREVMDLIATGSSMKAIAKQLEISIQTCSKHRNRVLEKLGVANDVELVRLLLAADRR